MTIMGWLVGRSWDWGAEGMPEEVELAHRKHLESRLD